MLPGLRLEKNAKRNFDISKQGAIAYMEKMATQARHEPTKQAFLEDIEFYTDQRDGLRLYSIGGVDMKLAVKEKADARRKEISREFALRRDSKENGFALTSDEAGKFRTEVLRIFNDGDVIVA